MKKSNFLIAFILLLPFITFAQALPAASSNISSGSTIDFISDTQQPMLVEKILLKPTHNKEATTALFSEIVKTKPQMVYMLGDIVALGFRNRKWKKVDHFLEDCRSENTMVCGLLGNHDIMGRRKKGERNFDRRFPQNVRTGYVSVTDSVAVVLLNSNFNTLSVADIKKQNDWYQSALNSLDTNQSVKAVIVACHHAPYSNSKVVRSSAAVQKNFVPPYIMCKKAQLFITGHSHNFEHFKLMGKDFLVIGGGGGLHQPLDTSAGSIPDLAFHYKPLFHYLSVSRVADQLRVTSYFLKDDFTTFGMGHSFQTSLPDNALTKNQADKLYRHH